MFTYWHRILFLVLILTFLPKWLYGQDSLRHKKEKNIIEIVDTLFIDRDVSHWSVHALTNFKDINFKLSNENNTLLYTPNNRSGVGIGLATSKLMIDLILNLKTNKEEITDRFDMQGNVLLGQEFFFFQVQNYKGFNVKNTSIDDPGIFRRDMKTFVSSLSYTHIFKSGVKTLNAIYTGVNRNYSSAGSFLAGLYGSFHMIQADSSIVPESSKDLFNEEAQIVDMKKYAIGITGGYAYFLKLPKNFFLLAALTPGMGLNFKYVQSVSSSYHLTGLMEFYLYTNIALGYNGSRYYIGISDENEWAFSSLGNGNHGSMNSTKFKLTIGWKLRKSVG